MTIEIMSSDMCNSETTNIFIRETQLVPIVGGFLIHELLFKVEETTGNVA